MCSPPPLGGGPVGGGLCGLRAPRLEGAAPDVHPYSSCPPITPSSLWPEERSQALVARETVGAQPHALHFLLPLSACLAPCGAQIHHLSGQRWYPAPPGGSRSLPTTLVALSRREHQTDSVWLPSMEGPPVRPTPTDPGCFLLAPRPFLCDRRRARAMDACAQIS